MEALKLLAAGIGMGGESCLALSGPILLQLGSIFQQKSVQKMLKEEERRNDESQKR